MLLRLIRWSKGYVDFSAYGKFPERFINLTTRNGINVWNLKPVQNGLTATMQVYDYKNIRSIASKSKLRLRVTGMDFRFTHNATSKGQDFLSALLSV